jgi:hypothetical protein
VLFFDLDFRKQKQALKSVPAVQYPFKKSNHKKIEAQTFVEADYIV